MSSLPQQTEKNLARRHAASRRFRLYGWLAIVFAGAMLLWLVGGMVLPGIHGVMRYEMRLVVSAEDVAKANGEGAAGNSIRLLHAAFDRAWKDTEAMSARQRYMVLGTFASTLLRDTPKLQAGEERVLWVPLSDKADQFLKYGASRANTLSTAQQALLEAMDAKGALHYRLNREFFTQGDSRAPESAGVMASVVGSLLLVLVAMMLALPIGVMAAVYLEEFAKPGLFSSVVEVAINNLAAVPSIIFGLLGLSLYLILFDLPRSSALVGGLTVALMVLPTIIITTRAALRAVPPSVRLAAIALGASPVQVAGHHVVPYALPGIMTGAILAIARALGETAPLLMIGMVAFVADIPRGLFDPATALPVQVYLWAGSPEAGFAEKTASAILLLLAMLACLNALAVWIRNRFEIRW